MQTDQLEQFTKGEDRVFTDVKGEYYIGREKLTPEMRELLKDQARNFKTTQLYEILQATIINEAYHLALIQSTDFEQVTSAKMLYHWQFVLDNLLLKLTS